MLAIHNLGGANCHEKLGWPPSTLESHLIAARNVKGKEVKSTMLKKGTILGFGVALLLLALATPSLAATVKVTDTALEPETITVGRGEEIVWVDATTSRTAHVDVALHFGKQPGAHITLTKDGNVRVRFDEPGTYEYHAHVGAGGLGPRTLGGKIIVK